MKSFILERAEGTAIALRASSFLSSRERAAATPFPLPRPRPPPPGPARPAVL